LVEYRALATFWWLDRMAARHPLLKFKPGNCHAVIAARPPVRFLAAAMTGLRRPTSRGETYNRAPVCGDDVVSPLPDADQVGQALEEIRRQQIKRRMWCQHLAYPSKLRGEGDAIQNRIAFRPPLSAPASRKSLLGSGCETRKRRSPDHKVRSYDKAKPGRRSFRKRREQR
jgi:hypothetical protein